ncbi:MAG: efflux RND transporter periplasmic adaptor subunit [Candidatus Moranbacteria bacterium]|nr:efflux RND transporter periplasmic adaptor subunit [Candidatus Moranbacteria bacterium]
MKNYWKKHKKMIVIVVIVLIGGGYFWYNKTHSTTTAVQYKTTVAQKGSITTSISGSGNVVVDQLATVDPTITGTVSNLSIKVGDNVKKGSMLFNIINTDLSVSNNKAIASLQQAKNAVDSAELQIKQAKADYKAAKKDDSSTSDQRKILDEKINIAENGLIAAQKSYAANLSDYNNQLANSAKRTVTAPIDGTVSAINIKNGDDLSRLSSSSSSSAPIIIGDLSTLKAEVLVNEVDIPSVSIGQKVMMTFGAVDGLTVSGKVEKMDALGTISQGVVSYGVTIGFDTIDSRIKPSMSVSAKIITQVKQDVVTVPNSALKVQENKTYVEVLKSGSQNPQQITIEIGVANTVETEIVSGINVGDNVVTQTIDPNAKATASTSSNNRAGGGMGFFGGR